LAAEAIQIITVGILQFIYGIDLVIQAKIHGQGSSLADSEGLQALIEKGMAGEVLYLISVIAVAVCGIVFFFWYRKEIRGEVRGSLSKLFTVRNIILLIFLGIGCQFFITGFMSVIQKYFTRLFDAYVKQMDQLQDGNIITVLLLFIIIAPITEELVFRGVILHKANQYVSFLGANILQALLFGLYHWNVIQGFYAAILGFILGAIYYKFRSIVASMLLHMAVNSSSFLIILFPDKVWASYLLIFGGVVLLIITLLLINPLQTLVPNKLKVQS
jgi:membrane protease YdiL (CAAX protease family)